MRASGGRWRDNSRATAIGSPSRCLHSIEFFSYLIASEAEAIVIGQVKEIARHEGQTRPPPIAFS
jgi:hypothetical protein